MHIRLTIALLMLGGAYALPTFAAPKGQEADVSSEVLTDSANVVFTWDSDQKVPFTVTSPPGKVVLHFDSPVALRWKQALPALRDYVREVDTSPDGRTVVLSLRTPAKAHRLFLSGKGGIDTGKNGLELKSAPATTVASNSPALPIETLPIPIISPKPHKPVVHASVHKPAAHLVKKKNADEALAEHFAALSPAAGPTEAAAPVPTVQPAPLTAPPAQLIAEKDAITLPLKADAPVAVFVRQKTLWIVAPADSGLTAQALHTANLHLGQSFQEVSNASHAAVFTLPLGGDLSPAMVKTAEGLQVLLDKTPHPPAVALIPALHTEGNLRSIAIATGKAETLVTLRDSATNNELDIVPVPVAGAGVASGRVFTQLALLPSAQGIVVQKTADDVVLALQKGTLNISSPRGLAISADAAVQMQEAETDAANSHSPDVLFPYARWKLADEKDFVPTENKYFHDIEYGTAEVANKARLKLLGLYLAEGLFAEARGMSNDILRVSYQLYKNHKVAAMRGAAFLFDYRINEAERDFSSPELANDPEAQMWRTLCRELLGESKEPFNFLANYDHIIRYYPPVFIQKLAIIAADRSINRKDYDTANSILDILKRDNIEDPVKKYADYMHAKILSETHEEEEASRIWAKQAADVEDPLIRARAEFSLVNMLLRQEKISSIEAEQRLEKLRIVWRDDSLELNVLTLLGDLYIADKQYDKALYTLRDIVLYYPEVPEAVTTAKKMEDIFVMLFNKGGADSMPPLAALSLFYEFRDLVPIGPTGDEMIRNLADRLVNIDLLDRAELLLSHQVQKRLQGEERSRVGTRLALIYLLNHQPKEALETLKTTGYGDLPADLKLARLRLTAQALAEQGQVQKAIDVLSADTSADGALQRLSIYWDNKDWPNVVSVAEEILANRNDPSAPLNKQESDVLLKLATAYVYEHDSGQIQYLRDYFTPLLKGNPNRDSFLFITSESGTLDYENLSNLEQDITTVKSFIETYRDKVKKNGLSSAIN